MESSQEFFSTGFDCGANWNKAELDLSRPGKCLDNALVEAFDSRFRQECFNEQWLLSINDAQQKILTWQIECSAERRHSH